MKNKKTIWLVLLVALIVVFIVIQNKKSVSEVVENPYANSDITVQTLEGENGWGYDILIDGEMYVHQPTIPALPGTSNFNSEQDARAVAELMIKKIRENILPPGVTAEEVNEILNN